jgi:RHS repeat-associated protein
VRTVDLNFDKNIDILRPIGTGYQVWYALGQRMNEDAPRFSERILTPGASHEGSTLVFADELGNPVPGTTLADMNGDRVTDAARIRPSSVIVAYSLGYGNFTESLTMQIPPDSGFGHDGGFSVLSGDHVGRAELIDITGNGLSDLVVREAGFRELWYWINLGNGTFDQRRIVNNLPSNFSAETADVRWADINGNGTDDLVYADSSLPNGQKLRAIDIGVLINGNACPFLMETLTNGIGMRTEIEYRPSTAFAADDLRAGAPWTSPLPNPTNLVSRLRVFDGLGNDYVTEFRFHNGFYHGEEKEFRGFSEAERREIGDANQPTLLSEFEFDVGREVEALKGKMTRQVDKTLQGQIFSEIANTWETRRLFTITPTPMNRLAPLGVTYPFLAGSVEHLREQPSGATEAVMIESAFLYDDYGNQVMASNYGRVEGGDRNAGEDERISWTVYSATPDAPIWTAAVETVQTDNAEPPRLVSHSQAFCDGLAFVGLPLGSVPVGNQTRSRDWVGPDNPVDPPNPLPDPVPRFVEVTVNADNTLDLSVVDTQKQVVGPEVDHWIETSRNQFDEFGNIVCTADPLASIQGDTPDSAVGHFQKVAYDDLLFTYPVMEEVYTGQTMLTFGASYDRAFGLVSGSVDLNGHASSYGYDPFGRLVRIVKPGGSPPDTMEMPSYTFEYVLNESVPTVGGSGSVNYVESRTHEEHGDPNAYFVSRKYFDGLARTVLIKEEDELASRSVVKEAYVFNERKMTRRILLPFYGEVGLGFENIHDPAWTGTWVIDGQDQVLGLTEAPATETAYDPTGRELQTIQPDGSFSRSTYFPLRNHIEDENDTDTESKYFGTPKVTISDGLGRMIAVEEHVRLNDDGTPREDVAVWRTEYAYDLLDNLTEIVDSQNNRKTLKYDALKRMVYMDDPNRGRMWYEYDDASNRIRSVDAKGQRITQTFDGTNRILTEDYHDEGQPFSFERAYDPNLPIDETNQPDVAYFYDMPPGPIDLGNGQMGTAENTRGFLSYVVDLSGEEHTSYDERGRIAWEVKRIPDPENGALVSYGHRIEYDAMDRIVDYECPDGDRIGYQYNDRTLLENVTGGETANRDGNPFIVNGIDYLPTGQKRNMTYGNGVASSMSYDNRLRMNELVTAKGVEPENPLLHYGYTFDGVSNVDRIDDLRTGVDRGAGNSRRNTQILQYDDLYRLTRVQYSFALPGQMERNDGVVDYRYDRIGNMLFKSSPEGEGHIDPEPGEESVVNLGAMSYGGALGASGRDGRAPADPPGPHALTATVQDGTLSYDGNGNMDNLDGLVCAWDYKDRLVRVENEKTYAEYTYDYTDRRVIKKVWEKDDEGQIDDTDQKSTLYVTSNYEVREYDQPVKYVWDGDARVARITGTLNPDAQRVQQLRVHEGWNVYSLGVEAPDLAQQIAQQTGAADIVAYRWEESSDEYVSVRASDELHAGDIFWVQGADPAVLKINGTYADPMDRSVEAGNRWVPATGLEAVEVDRLLPPIAEMAWFYDSWNHRWRSRFTGGIAMFSVDPPAFLRPGLPVFIETEENLTASSPLPQSRIHYYHPDHISSANIVTDAHGNIVEETVFYPFGHPRRRETPGFGGGPSSSNYLFSQKELDKESGLQYFESRYLSGVLARFNRADPLIAVSAVGTLANPQGLNLYAYAGNNPLAYTDPGGEIFTTVVGAAVGGLMGGIVGAVKAKKGERWKGFAKGAAKGALFGALAGAVVDLIAITIVSCGAATPVAAGAAGILLAACALGPGAIAGASAAGGLVAGATSSGVDYAMAHGGEGQPEFSGSGLAASMGMGATIGAVSGGVGGVVAWGAAAAITPAAASGATTGLTNAVGALLSGPTQEDINQGGGYIQSKIIGRLEKKTERPSLSVALEPPPSLRSSFSNASFDSSSSLDLDRLDDMRSRSDSISSMKTEGIKWVDNPAYEPNRLDGVPDE